MAPSMERAHFVEQLMGQKKAAALPRFSLSEKAAAYASFEENGCVVFRDFIDGAGLDSIRAELAAVIDQQVTKHLPGIPLAPGHGFDRGLIEFAREKDDLRRRLYDLIQTLPSLPRTVATSQFLQVMTDLGIVRPSVSYQFRMDLPGDGRFLIPPHQEVNQIKSPNLRFVIVALTDTPVTLGALTVGIGSHKLGPVVPEIDEKLRYQYVHPDVYREKYPLRQVPLMAGEALVLHKLLIHGSTENVSDRTRWSLIMRSEDLAKMPYLDGDDSYLNFSRKA
jgi:hypothetical protein